MGAVVTLGGDHSKAIWRPDCRTIFEFMGPEASAPFRLEPTMFTVEEGSVLPQGGKAVYHIDRDLNRPFAGTWGYQPTSDYPIIYSNEPIYPIDLYDPFDPSTLTRESISRMENGGFRFSTRNYFDVRLTGVEGVKTLQLTANGNLIWSRDLTPAEIESGDVSTPWTLDNPLLVAYAGFAMMTLDLVPATIDSEPKATLHRGFFERNVYGFNCQALDGTGEFVYALGTCETKIKSPRYVGILHFGCFNVDTCTGSKAHLLERMGVDLGIVKEFKEFMATVMRRRRMRRGSGEVAPPVREEPVPEPVPESWLSGMAKWIGWR